MSDDFANWLRRERERAGYTQHELGDLIRVRPATISRWECGNRTPPHSARVLLERVLMRRKK
jgi:transcriptional regulator with XRE-family HTH domain